MAHVKNTNLPTDYSNKWHFFIDMDKIKLQEAAELEKVKLFPTKIRKN